ncbi:MAG TPA: hypothetical protein VMZ92_03015 [Planctomycetota bacterium]|nr:hypothetical protein [Planctomycetota bacterium]
MARTKDPHAATRKAWETRHRNARGEGSSATQIRGDYAANASSATVHRFERQGWTGPRKFERGIDDPPMGSLMSEAAALKETGLTLDQLADVAGAPPGSEVAVRRLGGGGAEVVSKFPDEAGVSVRRIHTGRHAVGARRGVRFIHNLSFTVRVGRQGEGIGADAFALEVESAVAHGFERIEVTAGGAGPARLEKKGIGEIGPLFSHGRDPRAVDLAGYYAWARMGFNSISKLPGPNGLAYLHDIMKKPGGPAWWKENGKAFVGVFDLTDGSTARRVHDEYLRLKRRQRNG